MLRVYAANTVIPGRCFICERAFEDGETATNTQFTYSPDWDSRLFGNKMVCDNCVHDIAELNGYVHQSELDNLKAVHGAEVTRYENLLDQAAATALPSAEGIAIEVAKLMKPKPAPKPRSTANAAS